MLIDHRTYTVRPGTLPLQMKVACRVSTAQSPIGRFQASDYYRQVNVRLNH